jgi:hypothetical protein
MGVEQWMRVVETVSNLAGFAVGRLKPRVPGGLETTAGGGPLETRLAGVAVAALKEAFDRDRVRIDLEREQIEAERRRAEQALNAELRRQAADRAHGELRLIAIMGIAVWMLSAALAAWLPGMGGRIPRVFLGAGWACAFGAVGSAFAGGQALSTWNANANAAAARADAPPRGIGAFAPWLLLLALALTGASLLVAL